MSANKVILIADNHHGEGNNSEQINQDLLDFYDFVCEYAEGHEIEKLCLLGDFFHQRNKLDVLTINYGLRGAEKLYTHFRGISHDKPELTVGNHDLYYRHSRDTASVSMLEPYFEIINDPIINEDVAFIPWITGNEEWDQVVSEFKKKESRFVFGHFEYNGFRMNQNYVMENGYSHKEFKKAEHVFTGHYHARQTMNNVSYIGSPMPFNFNDANDPDRGFCVLDLDTGEYYFVNWNGYQVITVDEETFLDMDFQFRSPDQMSVRVDVSEDCDPKVLDQIKEKIEGSNFRNTKISYTPKKYRELVEDPQVDSSVADVENIDEAVIKHIKHSEPTEGIDNELLASLYQEAVEVAE